MAKPKTKTGDVQFKGIGWAIERLRKIGELRIDTSTVTFTPYAKFGDISHVPIMGWKYNLVGDITDIYEEVVERGLLKHGKS